MDMNFVGNAMKAGTNVMREDLDGEMNGNLRTENLTNKCGTYKRNSLIPKNYVFRNLVWA